MVERADVIDELRAKAASVSDPAARRRFIAAGSMVIPAYEDAISKIVELGINSENDLLNALLGPTNAIDGVLGRRRTSA